MSNYPSALMCGLVTPPLQDLSPLCIQLSAKIDIERRNATCHAIILLLQFKLHLVIVFHFAILRAGNSAREDQ